MIPRKTPMAKTEFILFDVSCGDGAMTSNRKVPGWALGGLQGDTPALEIIEAQDREIAKRSGRPRAPIKSIVRTVSK